MRVRFNPGYVLVLIMFFMSGMLGAQDLSDTLKLEEVAVFANTPPEEIASTAIRIDSLNLLLHHSDDLGELLSSSTPLYIKSAGPGSSSGASIRGTSATHTIVQWNGVTLNSPMRGDVDLSLQPVSFIDQADVLYSAASLGEGSGGLGGTIVLQNKPDWNRAFGIGLALDAGSYHTRGSRLDLSGGKGKVWGRLRTATLSSLNNYEFLNYGVNPWQMDTLSSSAFSYLSSQQELYMKTNHGLLSVKARELSSERELPQLIMNSSAENKEENQADRTADLSIDYSYYGVQSKLKINTAYHYQRLAYFLALGEDQLTGEKIINNDSEGTEQSWSGSASYTITPAQDLQFRTVYSLKYDRVNIFDSSEYVLSGYNEKRSEHSVLLAGFYRPARRLGAFLGNRSELVDGTFIPLIPSFGIEYSPAFRFPLLLKSTVARNYRFPALNDLYWVPGGNPELLPEKGFSFEAAVELGSRKNDAGKTMHLSLTGFYMLIHDWIEWRPGSRSYYWEPVNIGLVRSRGVELLADWKKKLGPSWQLKFNASYGLTRASDESEVSVLDETRGQQLIYIPLHRATLNGELKYRNLWLRLSVPYTGRIYTSSTGTVKDEVYLPEASSNEMLINPVLLFNISSGASIETPAGEFELGLSCRNLFDTPYTAVLNRPMPGRWLTLSLQYFFERRRDE